MYVNNSTNAKQKKTNYFDLFKNKKGPMDRCSKVWANEKIKGNNFCNILF